MLSVPQTQVIIDPYAKAILSRRRYGELGPQLDYESNDVLGLAATWPQAAAFLPKPSVGHMSDSAVAARKLVHARVPRLSSYWQK